MANIGVIGTGYVGLTTAVCFAELGHKVIGFDIDSSKIEVLASGKSTIHEIGMSELIVKNLANHNLTFKNQIEAIMDCEFIFLCVPTPQDANGSADLSYVIKATKDLSPLMKKDAVLITKSTVPVNAWKEVVKSLNRTDIAVVSNPEFYLCQAHLFVLPSLSEGFGIAVVEAMQQQVPCLCSNVGGIPEFITENETGWLFDPNNEEELVAKINTIIASPYREVQLIGTNGKNHVNERFTSEKYITNLENLYQELS